MAQAGVGRELGGAVDLEVDGTRFVVGSELMTKLMGLVRRVAPSSAAVLITGETGVGKEFIARAVHQHSLRADKPFVDINCAALPEHLVESELFGYEKGAFSGADAAKAGLFELADKGTLFLDEIGELDSKVQVKLLRVLDGAPYYRLGGSRKVSTNARIVAATNQPLDEAVRAGRFRRDLYHRLCQFQLRVPPLRERTQEIAPLVQYFLQRDNIGMQVGPETFQVLESYDWPGNIRELRNVILQASANADNGHILPGHLPPELLHAAQNGSAPAAPRATDLETMERRAILRTLEQTGGHQGMAAQQLGISRRTLCRKLKQYRIEAGNATSEALGVLSPEQQSSYRTTIEIPVHLKTTAGEDLALQSVNLSAGGISVGGIPDGHRLAGPVHLRFALPDGRSIQTRARVVWADPQGRAGIQFVEIGESDRAALAAWLRRLQAEEGWAAEEGREPSHPH